MTAYARLAEGEFQGAYDGFEAVLRCEVLRADLDGDHLFNAACTVSRALAERSSDYETKSMQGLRWLCEAIGRRTTRLAEIATELVVCDARQHAALQTEQEAHSRHLAAMRDEPRLTRLREHPSYASMVRELAKPG